MAFLSSYPIVIKESLLTSCDNTLVEATRTVTVNLSEVSL
jgi:hypothetical protein